MILACVTPGARTALAIQEAGPLAVKASRRRHAGDHDIVLGNGEDADVEENGASPLVFFRRGYRTLPGMVRLG